MALRKRSGPDIAISAMDSRNTRDGLQGAEEVSNSHEALERADSVPSVADSVAFHRQTIALAMGDSNQLYDGKTLVISLVVELGVVIDAVRDVVQSGVVELRAVRMAELNTVREGSDGLGLWMNTRSGEALNRVSFHGPTGSCRELIYTIQWILVMNEWQVE
jgi:hypothetical protein